MGLKEKRVIQDFRQNIFPGIEKQIIAATGFVLPMDIAWDTLQEDRFSHLYHDTFVKIYFEPLIAAFNAIATDALGQELLQNGLEKVVIQNSKNQSNPDTAITFCSGVLTIDHSPVLNADAIEQRTDCIITLLEQYLESAAVQDTTKSQGDFSFEVLEQGISITKYNGSDKKVVIPEEIQNKKVIGLAAHCFQEMDLEQVILPKTLLFIGKQALDGNKLTQIDLPPALQEVAEDAFYGNSLEMLVLPDSLKTIGDGAFSRNNITTLILPKDMKKIPNYCFSNSGVSKVVLPQGLTHIGESAFTGNTLQFLSIPKSVTSIGPQAFSESKVLQKVKMPESFKDSIESIFYKSAIQDITFAYIGLEQVDQNQQEVPKQDSQKSKITLGQLHNQSVALSLERQQHLEQVIQDLPWTCDILKGTVTYGEDLVFTMQVLGTYNQKEESWLWAWANKESGIPQEFTEGSLALKAIGERYGIAQLSHAKMKTKKDPGHYFSFIANNLVASSCYVALPFKGITVYALLQSDLVDAKAIETPALICSHFAKAVTQMDFSHKHALYCYLNQKGYEVTFSGNNILATKEDDQILGIFDLKGRLLKVSNNKVAAPTA